MKRHDTLSVCLKQRRKVGQIFQATVSLSSMRHRAGMSRSFILTSYVICTCIHDIFTYEPCVKVVSGLHMHLRMFTVPLNCMEYSMHTTRCHHTKNQYDENTDVQN